MVSTSLFMVLSILIIITLKSILITCLSPFHLALLLEVFLVFSFGFCNLFSHFDCLFVFISVD